MKKNVVALTLAAALVAGAFVAPVVKADTLTKVETADEDTDDFNWSDLTTGNPDDPNGQPVNVVVGDGESEVPGNNEAEAPAEEETEARTPWKIVVFHSKAEAKAAYPTKEPVNVDGDWDVFFWSEEDFNDAVNYGAGLNIVAVDPSLTAPETEEEAGEKEEAKEEAGEKEEAKEEAKKEEKSEKSEKSETAPKTGDLSVLTYAVSALAAAGAFVASKKRN